MLEELAVEGLFLFLLWHKALPKDLLRQNTVLKVGLLSEGLRKLVLW